MQPAIQCSRRHITKRSIAVALHSRTTGFPLLAGIRPEKPTLRLPAHSSTTILLTKWHELVRVMARGPGLTGGRDYEIRSGKVLASLFMGRVKELR